MSDDGGTPAEGPLAGRVVGRAGHAVPGATVMITGASPPHPDIAAVTGADGRFRFSRLTAGRYELLVQASGDAGTTVEVTVEPGEPAEVEIHVDE